MTENKIGFNSLYLHAQPSEERVLSDEIEDLEARALALEVENNRLREALEFYAEPAKYEYEPSNAPFETLPDIIACLDEGDTANKALWQPSPEPSKLMAVLEAFKKMKCTTGHHYSSTDYHDKCTFYENDECDCGWDDFVNSVEAL